MSWRLVLLAVAVFAAILFRLLFCVPLWRNC
jgi:hypothetical protein